jgi:hypothetical protein
MSEAQEVPAGSDLAPRATIRPGPFDLGVTYEGATLEGTLHLTPANEVQKVHVDDEASREVLTGVDGFGLFARG